MSQKYAILGLLNISPMTGYMIKKNLELSMKKFWPISYGGLYPTLHKLSNEQMVQVEDNDGNRGQLLYHITPQGKRVFHEWMKNKNCTIQNKDEYILKLFLSKDLKKQERIDLLRNYLLQKKQMYHDIQSILDKQKQEQLYYDKGMEIVSKYSLLTLESEINILNTIIEEENHD